MADLQGTALIITASAGMVTGVGAIVRSFRLDHRQQRKIDAKADRSVTDEWRLLVDGFRQEVVRYQTRINELEQKIDAAEQRTDEAESKARECERGRERDRVRIEWLEKEITRWTGRPPNGDAG
jgi:chromosome segregation ATPase